MPPGAPAGGGLSAHMRAGGDLRSWGSPPPPARSPRGLLSTVARHNRGRVRRVYSPSNLKTACVCVGYSVQHSPPPCHASKSTSAAVSHTVRGLTHSTPPGHGGEQESERASESQREMHADAGRGGRLPYSTGTHTRTRYRSSTRQPAPDIAGTRLHTGYTNMAIRNSRSHTQ